MAGHPVKAVAPLPSDMLNVNSRIRSQLEHGASSGLLSTGDPDTYLSNLSVSEQYSILRDCSLVIECVTEKPDVKEQVYRRITSVVSASAAIATNTSAIPISVLQEAVEGPERFLGIHWAEPAYLTRFLEITCGEKTDESVATQVLSWAQSWGKEPTLLRKDIRGFVTNRLMYAVYREIFHLLDHNIADMDAVDKVFRYDAGSWMTLMGIFRRLDFTGFRDYDLVIRSLMPGLSSTPDVPETMRALVESEGKGVFNLNGLYQYTEEEARQWQDAFSEFNREIHLLASKYSEAYINQQITIQN